MGIETLRKSLADFDWEFARLEQQEASKIDDSPQVGQLVARIKQRRQSLWQVLVELQAAFDAPVVPAASDEEIVVHYGNKTLHLRPMDGGRVVIQMFEQMGVFSQSFVGQVASESELLVQFEGKAWGPVDFSDPMIRMIGEFAIETSLRQAGQI